MTLWLLVPLFALAQATCYDYEYYDPDTGASLPGNACARQQAAAAGQPVAAVGTTQTFGTPAVATTTTFGTPVATATTFGTVAAPATFAAPATTFAAPATTFAAAPVATTYGTATFGTPAVATTSFATPYATSAPLVTATYGTPVATTVYGTATPIVATPVATTAVVTAPVATTVYGTAVAPRAVATVSTTAAVQARGAGQGQGQGQGSGLSPELEYYRRLGEEQQRQHKQNKRIVDRASRELSRASLVNTIVAGSGNAAPWYPALRLSKQRDAAGAYKSEARIANKNAEDAYRRYQQNPTRLNLLVSKYQDLNADLRDSAYHYNVVNSATYGQIISRSTGLFNFGGNGLLSGLSQIISQRQIQDDLNGIQRQMQRVGRQIQDEVRSATGGAQAQAQQGSVQQRMMAMSVYGPQAQQARG